MNGLWAYACREGLSDSLNPCIFMSCAVFIAWGAWFQKNSFHVNRLRALFVLVYALSSLGFNFGPFQVLVLSKNFTLAAKFIYFILGFAALLAGFWFLKDWYVLNIGGSQAPELAAPRPPKRFPAAFVTIISAVFTSALASVGPISSYMVMLGFGVLFKGQWKAGFPVLGGYIVASMWPMWLMWLFLNLRVRRSMVKIISAAVFFIASSSMILIFKP